MSTTIEGTTVRFERDPADWRRHMIAVQVESRSKPGFKAMHHIDPGKAVNAQHLMKGIAAAAAVCAEYLAKKYKDAIDPSTCIQNALRAFGEECRLMGELAKDLPIKLQRLKTSDRLNGKERELLERMIWLTNRGEKLTRDEGEWVNEQIGKMHGVQL